MNTTPDIPSFCSKSWASLTSSDISEKLLCVALVGNPNSGKTSLFNILTGARQHVGNYPGVTIEKKEGALTHKGCMMNLIDLPGTYALSSYSAEELITRNYIMDARPDVIIDVIDSTNIERNLYLTTQLIELQVPIVIAFNMSDDARRKGIQTDTELLSQLLRVPVVPTVGTTGRGVDELLDSVVAVSRKEHRIPVDFIKYGPEVERELNHLSALLGTEHPLLTRYHPRWLSLKLLERDPDILISGFSHELLEAASASRNRLKALLRDDAETIIADRRYAFISGACTETVKTTVQSRRDMTDRIDAIVTSRALGLPIFALSMYLTFYLTFKVSELPMAALEHAFGWLSTTISAIWPAGSAQPLKSLLIDGIIGGVGGVIIFLPNILLLFLAISWLEDSGYMARAAFIMDRTMHRIGLHGTSFIPMIIGFGCTIPAIMATRILENRRNRLTTILVLPLFSCGARLTIYSLIIPAFFAPKYRAPILWLIYMIGIILAIVAARVLRNTAFKGESTPFVMELPSYRLPTARSLLLHMWERAKMYLRKAGTTILLISVVLWALASYPKPSADQMAGLSTEQAQTLQQQSSLIGRFGRVIEPAIRPLGFDYRVGTALLGAIAAKEVFVSQLAVVYSLGEIHGNLDDLRAALRHDYSPLQGFCIMLFCLISAPCIATFAVTRSETGHIGWALAQWAGLTVMGYLATFVVCQFGSLL